MSISEEVKQRAMATHLFEQMRWMPVLALIPLAIIALVLWEHAPSIPVLLWLITMTLAEMLLMVVTRLPIGEREVTPKLSLRLFVVLQLGLAVGWVSVDRKSTRLNSSHVRISYAVFCLKKKTKP